MTQDDSNNRIYIDLVPRAVACMRGSLRKNNLSYDAEVKWDNGQWVISTGHETREAAMAVAQPIANAILIAQRKAAKEILSAYLHAKE